MPPPGERSQRGDEPARLVKAQGTRGETGQTGHFGDIERIGHGASMAVDAASISSAKIRAPHICQV
jgi:hypothetical protein